MTSMPPSPLSQVTRADRAVHEDAWIVQLLHRAPMGVLATAALTPDGNAQPFISTLLFAFDEAQHVIYLHTAQRGRVWGNLQSNERVCFTISEMGRMLPAAQALNFSAEYASVVVFGRAALVQDMAEATRGLQLTLDKYFPHLKPGQDYRAIVPNELAVTAVYRLSIDEWSGKKKEVAADFPGAFSYPYMAEGGG